MADLINDAIRAYVARASRACAEMADDSADIAELRGRPLADGPA